MRMSPPVAVSETFSVPFRGDTVFIRPHIKKVEVIDKNDAMLYIYI